jgi:hypothetical protein
MLSKIPKVPGFPGFSLSAIFAFIFTPSLLPVLPPLFLPPKENKKEAKNKRSYPPLNLPPPLPSWYPQLCKYYFRKIVEK